MLASRRARSAARCASAVSTATGIGTGDGTDTTVPVAAAGAAVIADALEPVGTGPAEEAACALPPTLAYATAAATIPTAINPAAAMMSMWSFLSSRSGPDRIGSSVRFWGATERPVQEHERMPAMAAVSSPSVGG